MDPGWCVVHTQPRAEEKAMRHLVNQGFTVYLPRYRRRIRHARQTTQQLRPLFPSYLFVRLDPQRGRWRSINGTVGVHCILTDGEIPRYLDDRIIADIMGREDDTGAVKMRTPRYRSGQAVRVTDGPLGELDGVFEETRDESRVVILISLLGRKVRMQLPADAVAAA